MDFLMIERNKCMASLKAEHGPKYDTSQMFVHCKKCNKMVKMNVQTINQHIKSKTHLEESD